MPKSVNKIIHYRDYGKNYHRLEFNSNILRNVQYVGGDFGSLIPNEMKLNTNLKQSFEEPLFNKSNNGNITELINEPTIIYLELRKDMAVKELYGPANKVAYDLFYGEESLIYSLYGDLKDTLSFNFKVYKDKNNIYQKLKTNPEDIYFRHHFINRALANANRTFEVADSESYRELMTGDQTADFLQIGKKTFQNWVSDGKIPFTVIGKQRFFKKSELLQDNQNYLQKKS